MYRFFITLVLVALPTITFAQTSLQNALIDLMDFINQVIIPVILTIAFLIFAVNAVRYFVIESNSEDGRAKARSLVIYSVSAFVAILLFYGLVNILVNGLGITSSMRGGTDYSVPDYLNHNINNNHFTA